MSEGRCVSCRYWDATDARWQCHRSDQLIGWCRLAQQHDVGPMMLAVCDSEGIYADLITDAQFGCILHEPKAIG